MNTPRAGQGRNIPRFAFALSLLVLFAMLVGYGALLQYVEQTRKPAVRLLHISEYGAQKYQDAFIRAYYTDGCI